MAGSISRREEGIGASALGYYGADMKVNDDAFWMSVIAACGSRGL
jgi:hypothetical protein